MTRSFPLFFIEYAKLIADSAILGTACNESAIIYSYMYAAYLNHIQYVAIPQSVCKVESCS
jgi:hypothetical protein